MGRKNKSEEKRQLILDAFETVILREGYANASQRKIAEEAGINQPMIHHYFSGGDELIKALLERITERYREALSTFTSNTDQTPSLESALAFLCSDAFHQVSLQNEVMFRLIGQAQHHDTAIQLLSRVYHELKAELTNYLSNLELDDPDHTAYTLMCLVVGHDWVKSLGFGEHRNEIMASTLEKLSTNH